jgi:hypothetical protein
MTKPSKKNGWVRGVAEGLFPSVLFLSATWDEMSQQSIGAEADLIIGLNQGFQISRAAPDASSETCTIIIDVGLRDQFDTDSIQQANLLMTAEVLADKLIAELNSTAAEALIQIGGIQKIPYYKKWGMTSSGVGLSLDLTLAGCGDFNYPDMATYVKAIGRDISPYDWQGTTPR